MVKEVDVKKNHVGVENGRKDTDSEGEAEGCRKERRRQLAESIADLVVRERRRRMAARSQ